MEIYYAHREGDRAQTVEEHLRGTAERSAAWRAAGWWTTPPPAPWNVPGGMLSGRPAVWRVTTADCRTWAISGWTGRMRLP